jgi:hypothetical protein
MPDSVDRITPGRSSPGEKNSKRKKTESPQIMENI